MPPASAQSSPSADTKTGAAVSAKTSMQIKKTSPIYDVVVIGSGASGGMAAWNLTRQGVKVLLLDAGDRFDPDKFWMGLLPYERRERLQRGERPQLGFLSAREQPLLAPPGQTYTL